MEKNTGKFSCIFFIPCSTADTERVIWTITSIRRFCSNYKIYLLLDGPQISDIPASVFGPDIFIKENLAPTKKHWGRIWHMQCTAMMQAYRDEEISPDAIFVKIDADAVLVRAGFIERAQNIFRTRPAAGQLGQCHSSVLGGRLGNRGWANFFKLMTGWRGLLKFIKISFKENKNYIIAFNKFFELRSLINCARKNGYVDGEFAIGGCYILRRDFVRNLFESNLVENSPFLWLPDTGEDGVMTPFVYAMGYAAVDDCSEGGIFGIEGKEFRISPFVLKERGHYILHPFKYGYNQDGYTLSEYSLAEKLIQN